MPRRSLHFVDVDLPAEDERAVAFVDDGFALDVVFVANLADDLFEQVFDRHEPRGPAVFVDDDRELRLAPLHLLEQLGDALALGHEVGGAHQRRHRRLRGGRQRDQILDEHDADDVVEVVAVDGHPRVLLLAEQFAEILQCRVDRTATMSGRGVMTSRTTVSVKSTTDCSSSRPSSCEMTPSSSVRWRGPSGPLRQLRQERLSCPVPRRPGVVAVPPHVDDVHQRNGQRARQPCQRREYR